MAYLIFFGALSIILIVIAEWPQVIMGYHHLRGKDMMDLFPEFADWQQGDTILFISNRLNHESGKLEFIKMDEDLVQNERGKSVRIKPYQILFNDTHDKRNLARQYEDFHKEILPSLASRGNTSFSEASPHKKLLGTKKPEQKSPPKEESHQEVGQLREIYDPRLKTAHPIRSYSHDI